jgi:hypothetical protein
MPIKGSRRPPGPKGRPIVGMALAIRRDPLNALRNFARAYGDIVLFHVLMQERQQFKASWGREFQWLACQFSSGYSRLSTPRPWDCVIEPI